MPDPTRNQLVALAILTAGALVLFALVTIIELGQAGAL
jgi:hypothetical protein